MNQTKQTARDACALCGATQTQLMDCFGVPLCAQHAEALMASQEYRDSCESLAKVLAHHRDNVSFANLALVNRARKIAHRVVVGWVEENLTSREARAAERAREALAAVPTYSPFYPEAIVDLITDLLHLAHQEGQRPDEVINTAQMHFDAETQREV
jgi:hypothetical protein